MPTIKQAIKAIMAINGMTQQTTADKIGVCQAALNRTINKPDHRIESDLFPIVQALGCTMQVVFRDKDGKIIASVDYPQPETK